ncbi:hypothetical protein [Oceanirhabdus sp. W0125-5]|uniref:hypothetical protein n=1 Tax=Oceanirhabdus sp. W0125-5 TaxID=2999116 RepID=UPI0022F32B6F|nr:hypothetical protein [Oceanirhabdus sp. W0125-5]WBW98242.1 hypothetical protein OW730_05600 [Oceanirhabdus sp. W0125-5]
MRKNLLCIVLSAMIASGTLIGCTSNNSPQDNSKNTQKNEVVNTVKDSNPSKQKSKNNQTEIINEFNQYVKDNKKLTELVTYLDENIGYLSIDNATDLVLLLEVVQSDRFISINEQLHSDENDKILINTYNYENITLDNVDKIENEALKSLVTDLLKSHYKFIVTEGTYDAIIDYSAYNKYSNYIAEDIKSYFELMNVESDAPSFSDGTPVLSLEEQFDRAKNVANFMDKYHDSLRYNIMEHRYYVYMGTLLMNGPIRNIPIDSEYTSDEFKAFIKNVDLSNKKNLAVKELDSFKKLLVENDFKFTDNVKDYITSLWINLQN